MVIDTSAVVSILLDEPDADLLAASIAAAEHRLMAAASVLELTMVVEARLGPDGQRDVDDFIAYALAKTRNEPLLYKGGNFARTDITPA